jgi:hypothetical protein
VLGKETYIFVPEGTEKYGQFCRNDRSGNGRPQDRESIKGYAFHSRHVGSGIDKNTLFIVVELFNSTTSLIK